MEVPGADTSEEERENGQQPVTVHKLQNYQERQHQKIKILMGDEPVAGTPVSDTQSGYRYPGGGIAEWPQTVLKWCKGWTHGVGKEGSNQ